MSDDAQDEASIVPDPDALSEADLEYPTFEFPSGGIGADGAFSLSRERDYEGTVDWLEALAGAMRTHDLAVRGTDRQAIYGVAPEAVEMDFDIDEEGHRGTFEVTVRLRARAMTVGDADAPMAGARGGRGFIPVEMLTGERDPGEFRCYNWIDDPTADGQTEPDSAGQRADDEPS